MNEKKYLSLIAIWGIISIFAILGYYLGYINLHNNLSLYEVLMNAK